jgi:hypothetical protein
LSAKYEYFRRRGGKFVRVKKSEDFVTKPALEEEGYIAMAVKLDHNSGRYS